MPLPDFIGIGAMRSGTSWLDMILRTHPDIYLPERVKEIHFFNENYDKGIDYYKSFFPKERSVNNFSVIGEITPNYLLHKEVAKKIYETVPNAKLIAILRNPVDRAYSHYGFSRTFTDEQLPFSKYIREKPVVFEMGKYYTQLNYYLKYFERKQILVLIFEELMQKKKAGLANISNFLNLEYNQFEFNKLDTSVSSSYIPQFPKLKAFFRKIGNTLRDYDIHYPVNLAKKFNLHHAFGNQGKLPEMQPETRAWLLDQYETEINNLEKLLNRDLSIWKN